MRYYRALKQLIHRGRLARGEDPIVPVGDMVDLDHLSEDERLLLVDMGAVEEVDDAVYAEWKAADDAKRLRRWLDAHAGDDAEVVEALTGVSLNPPELPEALEGE